MNVKKLYLHRMIDNYIPEKILFINKGIIFPGIRKTGQSGNRANWIRDLLPMSPEWTYVLRDRLHFYRIAGLPDCRTPGIKKT